MPERSENALARARALHRSGDLDAARTAYEALLRVGSDTSRDPSGEVDLLGLLGVLAIQQDRTQQAEALLRQALDKGDEARVDARLQLRNLNSFIVMMQQTGRLQAAKRELATRSMPDWPEGVVPDSGERGVVLSLGRALLLFERAEAARHLLERAIPDPHGDAEAMVLAGRLQLELGEPEAALSLLERAEELAPDDANLLIAIGHAHHLLGHGDAARSMADRITRKWPVFAMPQRHSQRADVLVLNPKPSAVEKAQDGLAGLHFATNFPAQLVRDMQDEFRFHSAFVGPGPALLPPGGNRAQVVLNNCVNGEIMNMPGRLEQTLAAVRWAGVPVINQPEAVAATTRQKVALLLEGIPGLRVPGIARHRVGPENLDAVLADIEDQFGYPVILRQCHAHKSADYRYSGARQVAMLVHDRVAARTAITDFGAPEIYAIEYIDLRKKAGFFRKIRAVLAEDEVICAIPGFYSEWMVAGARRQTFGMKFYRAHPETVAESTRIVMDPAAVLGPDCLRVLDAVRDRMPLDFFGIDFDVDDDGQVVLFETNAAMNLLKYAEDPEDIALPDLPFERIKAAFRRAVDRRIGGRG